MSSFKLTQSDGVTRKLNFAEKPTWFALATKIELMFGIPIQNVAVSYIDSDNDEVTITTGEELDDYYNTSFEPSQTVKFNVRDISVSRSAIRTPPTNISANQSMTGDIFERLAAAQGFTDISADEPWQAVTFTDMYPPAGERTPPHIEIVDSTILSRTSEPASANSSVDTLKQPSTIDKGKGKATEKFASSTSSIVDGQVDSKIPVSVVDAAALPINEKTPSFIPLGVDGSTCFPEDPAIPSADEFPQASTEPPTHVNERPSASSVPVPSFLNDIASLLNGVSVAFASHPELSEGWNNILRNASNGQYWQAPREQFADASRRAVTVLDTVINDQATVRVAEAVGGIVRALTDTLAAVAVQPGAVPPNGSATPVPGANAVETQRADASPSDSADPPFADVYEKNLISHWDAHRRAKESKTRLEEAKSVYKQQKELFRAEKELLRRDKEERERRKKDANLVPPVPSTAPPPPPPMLAPVEPVVQFIETAGVPSAPSSGLQPPLEPTRVVRPTALTNPATHWVPAFPHAQPLHPRPIHAPTVVPSYAGVYTGRTGADVHRSNTWAHMARQRHINRASELNKRSSLAEAAFFNQVVRRLNDMGFNQQTNPQILKLVDNYMPKTEPATLVSRDMEDEVVSSILEALISGQNVPGPSNTHNNNTSMPGEW